jgi:hypothetical protein
MLSSNFLSDVISDLSALNDLIRHLGILVGPPKTMSQAEVDAHPDCMVSGDYHKMVRKKMDRVILGGSGPHGNTMVQE